MALIPAKKTVSVKLSNIRLDGGTQQRAEINADIVAEYSEAMKCGHKFPPVTLFFDSAQYWLADGFHRFYACRSAEILDILAEVYEGISRDAVLFSAGANAIHGLRPSNADKRKAVLMLLNDCEWAKWSNKQISRHCHVSDTFVSRLRDEQYSTNPKGQTFAPVKESGILKPAPTLKVENPISVENPEKNDACAENQEPEYTELNQAHEQIEDLQNIVAAGFMATTDEDRASGLKLLADLRKEIKTLRATLAATESQRDSYMREIGELKRQCAMQVKKIKKLEGAHAASA